MEVVAVKPSSVCWRFWRSWCTSCWSWANWCWILFHRLCSCSVLMSWSACCCIRHRRRFDSSAVLSCVGWPPAAPCWSPSFCDSSGRSSLVSFFCRVDIFFSASYWPGSHRCHQMLGSWPERKCLFTTCASSCKCSKEKYIQQKKYNWTVNLVELNKTQLITMQNMILIECKLLHLNSTMFPLWPPRQTKG